MEEEIKPRLSGTEAYFLIAFALIADLINWIPVINIITTVVTAAFFQFYFFIRKVKGAQWSLIGNIIEFIPVASVLPAITAGVVGTIIADRIQAKIDNKMAQTDSLKEPDLGYNYKDIEDQQEEDVEVENGAEENEEKNEGEPTEEESVQESIKK